VVASYRRRVASGHVVGRVCGRVLRALVDQRDGQALVEEGHLLQAARERLERPLCGLEDRAVRPEGHNRSGLVRLLAPLQRSYRLGVLIRLPPDVAILADFHLEPGGERVDDRDAHAVQAAGHRIGLAVELSAGVQRRQHNLNGRPLFNRVLVNRDATAIVGHPYPAVGEQDYLDPIGEPG
jgi:hypothetical protein